jgi:hypothetical protein
MEHNHNDDEEEITIAMLYPNLTREQQAEAEYHLHNYLKIVKRIFERVHGLTEVDQKDTINE